MGFLTPEIRLLMLYEVEKRIMTELRPKDYRDEGSWLILQDMIKEEYKARDDRERMT